MTIEDNGVKYAKVYDKRKKLFGIKVEGQKGWYIEPFFEELALHDFYRHGTEMWFKKDGAYGLYDVVGKRILIPAEYGYPLYFTCNGYALTWKNHKAGLIDHDGNVVIPFVYDEIHERWQSVEIPDEERRTVKDANGNDMKVGPKFRNILRGWACFTNEGGEQAYDEYGQPSSFEDWEKDCLNQTRKYDNQEVESMTLPELEEWIKKEFVTLLELGYDIRQKYACSDEHRQKVREQEEKVQSLIRDRRSMMNRSWVHNVENAQRIGRMNDLLMRSVSKAIKLGDKTSKSLQWMENIPNSYHYVVDVFVHPMWQNSKSDYRYERKYKSSAKERDRLIEDENNDSETHIWNIIATLGNGCKQDGMAVCFDKSSSEYQKGEWDVREMTGDDGQTWDECIHFPAYQDVYFTMPFHHLYLDLFDYSFEDLCNINDFRINVNVRLETREQDKR